MKRVCVLLQNHYDQDIRVRRKAEALVGAGYEVDVLALQGAPGKEREYTLNGVRVSTLSLNKKRGSFFRYIFEYVAFFFWAFYKVTLRMSSRRYSIIDINNLPDFLVFASLVAKWRGARIVFDMHEITPEFMMSKYGFPPNHRKVWFARMVEKASFNYADHVITINEPIVDLLVSRGLPRSKVTVIMNSVDEALFETSAGSSRNAGTAEASGRKFTMMYHGTLTRIYGLDVALEAFGLAQKEMPGAEFLILGNGPEKGALEALSRKLGLDGKVKLVGTVPPQEVVAWLKNCDAGVLATRQDVFLDLSFSNKLSEYIIMGKPVICSRLRTIRHYFSEEALAFFRPHDAADLARQMVSFYQSKERQLQFAERARIEYAPIRWEVMKARYLGLMDQIAGVTRPATPIREPGESELVGSLSLDRNQPR